MAPRPTTTKKVVAKPSGPASAISAQPKDIAQATGSERRGMGGDMRVDRPQIQQVRTRGMRLLFSPIEKSTPEGVPLQTLLGSQL